MGLLARQLGESLTMALLKKFAPYSSEMWLP